MVEIDKNLDIYVGIVAMCREYSYEHCMNLKPKVFSSQNLMAGMNDMERRISKSDVKESFAAMLSTDHKDIIGNFGGTIGEEFAASTLEYSVKWMNQRIIGKKSIFQAIVEYLELTRDVVLQEG